MEGLALRIILRGCAFVVNALGLIVGFGEDEAVDGVLGGTTKIEVGPLDKSAVSVELHDHTGLSSHGIA